MAHVYEFEPSKTVTYQIMSTNTEAVIDGCC